MVGLMVGFVLFLIGIVFLITGVAALKRAKRAQSWPIVPGRVIASRVVQHESTDSEGGSSVTYEPQVEYEYSVMGLTYSAKRVAFGTNRYDARKATEIADRYPAGSVVSVHYNPDKVKDATLETSASGGKLFPIIGGIIAASGLVVMVVSMFTL